MKNITLTNGKKAIIDDVDFAWLSQLRWNESRDSKNTSYARATIKRNGWSKRVSMHRLILDAKDGECVDHINGDGLDNRRENIRICSKAENNRWRKPHGKTSRYKGVSWRARDSRWLMQIHIPGSAKKRITELFPSDQEENAARRHDYWAKKFHKEFAFLNFPS